MVLVANIYIYAAAVGDGTQIFLYGVRLAEVKTITEDNDGIGCERMVFVVFINQLCQIISQYIKPLVYHIEMFAAEPSCIVAKLYRFYFGVSP